MLTDAERRMLTDAADTLEDADLAIRDATTLGCDPKALAAAIRAIRSAHHAGPNGGSDSRCGAASGAASFSQRFSRR